MFRLARGIEDEDKWGLWLASNGQSPALIRKNIVESYVRNEVMRQAANELNVGVSFGEVEQRVRADRASFGSNDMWNEFLDRLGIDESGYRLNVEIACLDQEISAAIIEANSLESADAHQQEEAIVR